MSPEHSPTRADGTNAKREKAPRDLSAAIAYSIEEMSEVSGLGKSFLYEAALEPVAVKSSVLKRFVKQIYGDDVISPVSTLVDGQDLSPEQLRQLRAIVERTAKDKSKKKTKGKRS